MIVSHVWNEAGIFVRSWVKKPQDFTRFLNLAFPGDKIQTIREAIEKQYPSRGHPFYNNQQDRLRKVLQDSTFVCNTRQLYEAYKGKTYVVRYDFPPATHGSDLLASSWHQGVDVSDLIKSFIEDLPDAFVGVLQAIISPFASSYQRYFAAHALNGDPNGLNANRRNAVNWELSSDDEGVIENALKAALISPGKNPFFSLTVDRESSTENCDFWTDIARQIGELYTVEKNLEDDSDGSEALFGLKIQGPGTDSPIMPEL